MPVSFHIVNLFSVLLIDSDMVDLLFGILHIEFLVNSITVNSVHLCKRAGKKTSDLIK